MQAEGSDRVMLDIDPFSRDGLIAPEPLDVAVRESAPVVWLERYGVWATGRHELVQAAFQDWKTFSSASGTGLANIRKGGAWRTPSVILENDPPSHSKYRAVMSRLFAPPVLRALRAQFEPVAEAMVDKAAQKGEFDLASELAEAFVFQVLPDAVGFTTENRRNLLTYSVLNFNAIGPHNEFYLEARKAAEPILAWVADQCRREALEPGGLGMMFYEAVDEGELTPDEAGLLVRTFISAGMDTTINGIGLTLLSLIENPDQWDLLKADPSLARGTFDEALRYRAPSPFIGRTTTGEVEFGGMQMAAEDKLLLWLGAAGRDPRHWERPEEFDITRRASGHMAFGFGVHGCVGQMLARLEAEVLIGAIARRFERLELTGPPQWQTINWLRGLTSLPVRGR